VIKIIEQDELPGNCMMVRSNWLGKETVERISKPI